MKWEKIILNVLPYIVVIILVVMLKAFVVTTVRVKGTSMMDTLHHGDVMILNRVKYRFQEVKRFDMVVVRLKEKNKEEDIIKRVIGLPGDKVSYRNNQLYINDQVVEENFAHKITEDFELAELGIETVPEGKYFIVGDNRGDSYDSRFFGVVDKKDILGEASVVVFPFNRIGEKK